MESKILALFKSSEKYITHCFAPQSTRQAYSICLAENAKSVFSRRPDKYSFEFLSTGEKLYRIAKTPNFWRFQDAILAVFLENKSYGK